LFQDLDGLGFHIFLKRVSSSESFWMAAEVKSIYSAEPEARPGWRVVAHLSARVSFGGIAGALAPRHRTAMLLVPHGLCCDMGRRARHGHGACGRWRCHPLWRHLAVNARNTLSAVRRSLVRLRRADAPAESNRAARCGTGRDDARRYRGRQPLHDFALVLHDA
jgi:hypothetical protein